MTDNNEIDGVVEENQTAEPVETAIPEPSEPEAVEAPAAEIPAEPANEEPAPADEPAPSAEPVPAAESATGIPEAPAEEPAIDPARKAELDALAAELQGVKVEKPKRSRRVTAKNPAEFVPAEEPVVAEPVAEAVEAAVAEPEPAAVVDAEAADAEAAEPVEGEESDETGDAEDGSEAASRRSRSRRGRNRNRSGADKPEGQQPASGQGGQNGQPQPQQADGEDRPSQGGNVRDRNRKRGQTRNDDELEPEILPDDVLLPIAGILDVLDNYAFVRTTGYLPGVTDVYVSLGQVKKYGLRKGDAVVGAIRQPRDGEQPGRQKYNALVRVDSVNGQTAEASLARPEFAAGTPLRPSAPLTLKTTAKGVALGKGQRALVTGGTASGKTRLVAEVAESVSANHPDAHLMVILAGARPEEATDFRRKVKGEVIVSTFEQSAEDLVTVVELAVERAKRLVELGLDVVVLIDSITQLGRAYFSLAPVSRAHADDPTFLLPAKRLFGSARAIEDGASLTIVATGSTDLSLDQLAITELSAVANAVVKLA